MYWYSFIQDKCRHRYLEICTGLIRSVISVSSSRISTYREGASAKQSRVKGSDLWDRYNLSICGAIPKPNR